MNDLILCPEVHPGVVGGPPSSREPGATQPGPQKGRLCGGGWRRLPGPLPIALALAGGGGGGPPTPHRPGRPTGPFLLGAQGEEPQSSRVCYSGFTGSLSPVLPTLGALTPASSPHGPAASGPPVSHGHAHPEPCPRPQPAVPLPISQSPDRRASRPAQNPEGCLAPSSPPRHPAKAPQPATSLTPRPPGPQQAHPQARLPAHAPQPGPLQPSHLPASPGPATLGPTHAPLQPGILTPWPPRH